MTISMPGYTTHSAPSSHRLSRVQEALAATLGAALVATARPNDTELRQELIDSALKLLPTMEKGNPGRKAAAVKQLIDVVGDPDVSRERIRRGSIAVFLEVSASEAAPR